MIEEEPKVLSIDEIDSKSVEILLNNGMDKFSVFVDESAQEKNTLFILLHGATYSKSTWSAFIAELRSNDILNTEVSVIAPDLRGHGNTHTDNIDLHLDIMSEYLFYVFLQLGMINKCWFQKFLLWLNSLSKFYQLVKHFTGRLSGDEWFYLVVREQSYAKLNFYVLILLISILTF